MGKREDILKATLDLISEEGLQSVTFSKIFKKANVGSGTFYNYFNNKEELVNEVYKEIVSHMGEVVLKNYNPSLTLFERFKYIIRKITDYAIDFSKELWFLENYSYSPYISIDLKNMENPAVTELLLIISQGQSQGIIQEINIMMCFQIIHGIIVNVIKGFLIGKYPLEEYHIQHLIEVCWKVIKI